MPQPPATPTAGPPATPLPMAPPEPVMKTVTVTKHRLVLHNQPVASEDKQHRLAYFLKRSAQPVPVPSSLSEATAVLAPLMDMGVLNGPLLASLERLVSGVYEPLAHASTDPDQFSAHVHKFATQLRSTLDNFKGHITLRVPPELAGSASALPAAPSHELLSELSRTLAQWVADLAGVLDQALRRTPAGPGPVAELEYWGDRNLVLTAVQEHFQAAPVVRCIEYARQHQVPETERLQERLAQLGKLFVEAKDNVKFLSTLERQFKNLEQSAGPAAAREALPGLFNGLKMVWVISRHYNNDQRMVPLMERIAWQLCDIVSRSVNPRTILRKPVADVRSACAEAKALLAAWEEQYFAMRAAIEEGGRDERWEFDRQRLFEKTSYQAAICTDLLSMAEVFFQLTKKRGENKENER